MWTRLVILGQQRAKSHYKKTGRPKGKNDKHKRKTDGYYERKTEAIYKGIPKNPLPK
jgi:hypothetical protein